MTHTGTWLPSAIAALLFHSNMLLSRNVTTLKIRFSRLVRKTFRKLVLLMSLPLLTHRLANKLGFDLLHVKLLTVLLYYVN